MVNLITKKFENSNRQLILQKGTTLKIREKLTKVCSTRHERNVRNQDTGNKNPPPMRNEGNIKLTE